MIRSMFGKALGVTMLTVALGILIAAPAMADSVPPPDNTSLGTLVSLINQGNTALTNQGLNGPYADIFVNFTSNTTARVTVEALPGFHIGGNDAFGFNTNYVGLVSDIRWSGGLADTSITCAGGSCPGGAPSGFGSMTDDFSAFDGATRAVTELQFTYTLTSGSFSGQLPSSFLVLNGVGGFDAFAHIFPVDTQFATGFAGENALGTCPPDQCRQTQVPEPASLLMLGAGLGFVGQRIRRKSRRA